MDLTKKEVILNNSWLVYKVINKYKNYTDIEDLYQVGCIGLLTAYNNYNSNFNTKFSSYAYLYILGEVNKYIKENRSIKVSKEYYTLYKKIVIAKETLAQKLMYEPSICELALYLEIDEKLINDCLQVVSYVDSLDRIISEDDKVLNMYDLISSNDKNPIDDIYLKEQLAKLQEEEINILNSRYFLDKTQSETAEYLGMTQVQVSRKEQKILKKLRDNMTAVS
ncbi:MAG: sigma-70 family RNA polymerase sigma factor [Bacilli bacterium]